MAAKQSTPSGRPLSAEQIFATIRESFAEFVQAEDAVAREPHLVLDAGAIANAQDRFTALMEFVRDDERLAFDLLSCVSGVDYPDRDVIEVVWFLDSTVHLHRLVLKAALPRANPEVPTVETVWRTADWHERECYDLLGVRFAGHHNLVRILCAEDWVGHPLRKDYVTPDEYHGIKNVVY